MLESTIVKQYVQFEEKDLVIIFLRLRQHVCEQIEFEIIRKYISTTFAAANIESVDSRAPEYFERLV